MLMIMPPKVEVVRRPESSFEQDMARVARRLELARRFRRRRRLCALRRLVVGRRHARPVASVPRLPDCVPG